MKDRATPKFRALLVALPAHIQELAHKQYRLYKTNQHHPSVDFKPLTNTKLPLWSARINDNYRAPARRETDADGGTVMVWFWIGSHREYEKLAGRS